MDRQLQACWPTHLKRLLNQNHPLQRGLAHLRRRAEVAQAANERYLVSV